ncbi:30S ribosomal protein S15 [Candidatus Cyanaurora vandensis]|uniref:30S ribosomal protein S15 n=1 Tax=Candidatus Cyanaurora vandensis TaxID=2714958 RepID=UPI00257A7798|nr:30S ribosomal protein S15 [Candidatus Cyanaurora vandensis]
MPLLQEQKQELIGSYQVHTTDTGSPEVQVALLSARVKQLTEHLKAHPKDFASRRGLLKIINQRKRLLSFVAKSDTQRYQQLIERLGLRR